MGEVAGRASGRTLRLVGWLLRTVPSRAIDVAVLRIAASANLLVSDDLRLAWQLADASPQGLVPAPLWRQPFAVLPHDPLLVRALVILTAASATAALLGLRARMACACAFVFGSIALYVPQRFGTVTHTHHVLWMLALLAASPCGDALAVGRWVGSNTARLRYGATIAAAWLLIGAVFFFPGVWKLLGGDGGWLDGRALIGHLHWKWFENGAVVAPRIDESPLLARALGIGAIVLELSLGVMVFVRRLRFVAVCAALAFHAFTAKLMGIFFPSLWTLYVVFVDWDRVAASVVGAKLRSARPTRGRRAHVGPLLAGAALLVPVLLFGALGEERGWPFACYPRFHRTPPPLAPTLVIVATAEDGREITVPHGPDLDPKHRQRAWGRVFALVGGYGDEPTESRLLAYFESLPDASSSIVSEARSIRFDRVWVSTVPGRWSTPVRRETLLEVTPPASSR